MPRTRLSKRQREVLRLIDQGLDTEAIAARLEISRWAVRDKVRAMSREFDAPMRDLPRVVRAAGLPF